MAKILTYNSPSGFEKKLPKGNIFKGLWEWFSSQEKYTKFFILTALLIIVATPFVVNNLLETRQRAEGPQQLTVQQSQDLAKLNNSHVLGADEFAVIKTERGTPSGKKIKTSIKLSNSGVFEFEGDKTTTISLVEGNDKSTILVGTEPNTTIYQLDDFAPKTDQKDSKIDSKITRRLVKQETVPVIIELNLPFDKFYDHSDSDNKRQDKKNKFEDAKGKVSSLFKGKGKLKNDLHIIKGVSADVDKDSLTALSASSLVKKVEFDKQYKVVLDESTSEIHAKDVWTLTDQKGQPLTGAGMRIAIVDTGVDYTHPDLGGCFGPNCKVIEGKDFVNGDNDPMDDAGHGTHVAVTAAGKGIAGDGTVLYGVAPDAKILAYKVCDSAERCYTSAIISGINYATDPNQDGNSADHVDVGSMSLGGSGDPDDSLSTAVDNSTTTGVVWTIAAGNAGPNPSTIGSPGTARTAITVAAACKASQINKNSYCTPGPIASFSSRGPLIWNGVDIKKPDIAAPGVYICAARWDSAFSASPGCFDSKHVRISGTSMATPHVAGAAALIRQAFPSYTPAQVKEILKTTARNLGASYEAQGAGEVDLKAAIPFSQKVKSTPAIWEVTTDPSVKTSITKQVFSITPTDPSISTLSASFNNLNAPGITVTSNKTTLQVSNGATDSFEVTVSVDNDQVKSQQYFGSVSLSDGGAVKATIPVFLIVKSTVTISPSDLLDYGVDNPSLSSWTSTTKTITVKNLRSDATQNFIISPTSFRAGINLQIAPTTLSVPAGGTANFDTNFIVDNSQVPNNIYNGSINISNSANSLTMPVKFTKFYIFYIHRPNPADFVHSDALHFVLHDGKSFYMLATPCGVGDCNADPIKIYLNNPGTYDFYAQFSVDSDSWDKHTFYEGLSVNSGETNLTINSDDAKNLVTIKATDFAGKVQPLSSYTETIHYAPGNGGIGDDFSTVSSYSGDASKIHWSNISSNYRVDVRYTWPGLQPAPNLIYYYESFTGLQGNMEFTNTQSDIKGPTLIRNDINRSSGNIYPELRECPPFSYWQLCSAQGTSGTLTIPVTQSIYTVRDPGSSFEDIVDYNYYFDSKSTNCPLTGACPYFFTSPHFFPTTKARQFLNSDASNMPAYTGNTIYNGLGPPFWTGKFNYTDSTSTLYVGGYSSIVNAPFLRQDYAVPNYDQAPYSLLKDSTIVNSGNIPAHLGLFPQYSMPPLLSFLKLSSYGKGSYEYKIDSYPYQIKGLNMNAKVSAKFNTSLTDPNPPFIKRINYFAKGSRDEVYDPAVENRFEFEMSPADYLTSAVNLASATASYSTDGVIFTPLTLANNNNVYGATLPTLTSLTKLTLSITGTDTAGNSLSYTFEIPKGTARGPMDVGIISPVAREQVLGGKVNTYTYVTGNVGNTTVQLYADDVLVDTTSTPPYTLVWNTTPPPPYGHTLKVVATDSAGNQATNTQVTVGVLPASSPTPTSPPSTSPTPSVVPITGILPGPSNLNVTLDQPKTGSVIPLGKTIVLSATASDTPGVNITKVEFYVNGARKCSDNSSPYTCNFKVGTTVGAIYTITAKAYDITGNTKVSSPSNVTGGIDTVFPSATLTSPLNGARVAVSFNIVISATASDTVGVSKVEFYVNGARKCSDTTAPYSCSWTVPAGTGITYTLNARAYDFANNTSNSTITVRSQ